MSSKPAIFVCCVLSLVGVGVSWGADASPQSTVRDADLFPVEAQILALTNAERAKYGLAPLALDKSLLQSARTHCNWMATSGAFQHTSANVAENIALGQGSAGEAVRDWMNSPGHRANILNGSYRRMGMAAYTGAGGKIYWCQQFMW